MVVFISIHDLMYPVEFVSLEVFHHGWYILITINEVIHLIVAQLFIINPIMWVFDKFFNLGNYMC